MTIKANSSGVLTTRFRIPAGVPAGTKNVAITGKGGSRGETTFIGEGTLNTVTKRRITSVTTVVTTVIDPLAQTFSLNASRQLGAAELFVSAKGDSPIIVQIRNTSNGFPNNEVLAEARLLPAELSVGQWNRWNFSAPVHLAPNTEYALVALCNDATAALAIAEMGKWDSNSQSWVTQQPYTVGVLLSSSNASTWTAHQDRDLAFRLLARRYTQTERIVDLGSVDIVDATDLIMLSMTDNPETGADSNLQLTLPSGQVINAGDDQVVQLGTATTGQVGVKAVLRATPTASAVLVPGSQLIAGSASLTADYVTNAMNGDATGCNVRVIFDALLPSGAGVSVFVSGADAGDAWIPVSQAGAALPLGDNVHEYQYLYEGLSEAMVRVKLVLSGTVAARPYVGNLRVSIT